MVLKGLKQARKEREKEGREKNKTNSIAKLGLDRMDTVQYWMGQAIEHG
jgi:hypothetical protein